jgi:hypothetical protein
MEASGMLIKVYVNGMVQRDKAQAKPFIASA